jgi:hypothetical protein
LGGECISRGVFVEDDTKFVGREGGGAIMVELVRIDSLTTFNVDVGSATLITFSCKLGDGYLGDVEVKA